MPLDTIDLVTAVRLSAPLLMAEPCELTTSLRLLTIVPMSTTPLNGNVLLPGFRVTSLTVALPMTRSVLPLLRSSVIVPTSKLSTEGFGSVRLATRLEPSSSAGKSNVLSAMENPSNLFKAISEISNGRPLY